MIMIKIKHLWDLIWLFLYGGYCFRHDIETFDCSLCRVEEAEKFRLREKRNLKRKEEIVDRIRREREKRIPSTPGGEEGG